MNAGDRLLAIKETIPESIMLIAVSKTKSETEMIKVYNCGQRHFGENYVQELVAKQASMPSDIHWHFIGHLQSNKVRFIAPFVHLIHSVDSIKLLREINKEAIKNSRTIDCLLELHIAEEETKNGMSVSEIDNILQSKEFETLQNVRICGLMGMATFTKNQQQIRDEFRSMKQIFDHLKSTVFSQEDCFTELSMGMTDDYQIAIEEGSTMVRIGSAIFGTREYKQ